MPPHTGGVTRCCVCADLDAVVCRREYTDGLGWGKKAENWRLVIPLARPRRSRSQQDRAPRTAHAHGSAGTTAAAAGTTGRAGAVRPIGLYRRLIGANGKPRRGCGRGTATGTAREEPHTLPVVMVCVFGRGIAVRCADLVGPAAAEHKGCRWSS